MSASDVESEERREGATDVINLVDAAARQVRERGRIGDEILRKVSRLGPQEAMFFLYVVERWANSSWEVLDELSDSIPRVKEVVLPKVAQYARGMFGVEMPLRASRGWTDKVLEALKDITVGDPREARERGMDEYLYPLASSELFEGVVSWERFREVLKYVPAQVLLDRQNESPTFLDFLEAASKVPGSYLRVYVVTKEREDERVTIDGILLPAQPEASGAIEGLLKGALGAPERFELFDERGKRYIDIWWD